MHPAVVTAVLLLVSTLDSVTGRPHTPDPADLCSEYPESPCGDGWSHIDKHRCAKLFTTMKTFKDAKAHCHTLDGDLVSLHDEDEVNRLVCLSWRSLSKRHTVWIGAQRFEGEFRNTDGSEFGYTRWHDGQPNNSGGHEDCIESNFDEWGLWNDASCSEEKYFVCAKNL